MKPISSFSWPQAKRAAVSLTFDDSRLSQADRGLPVLDQHGAKGTFYVMGDSVEMRLDAWRSAVARGHEIGNHTLSHPCSGNFAFSRNNPLEDLTLEQIDADIRAASVRIEQLLGITPKSFAYPCGQKFVGRGEALQSYVPVVSRLFLAGRSYNDESWNCPGFCDLAQLLGVGFDNLTFDQVMRWVEPAVEQGGWLIFVGHEVGDGGHQTTRQDMLDQLCRYCMASGSSIWLDRVDTIAEHIRQVRQG